MKTVSVFDSVMTAIREHRFSKGEALQIVDELRSVYPDVFEQAGMDGHYPADFAERLPGRHGFGERMQETEHFKTDIDAEET
jgi:hypothetical protein